MTSISAGGSSGDSDVEGIESLLERCTFPAVQEGSDVALAVSGGPDSLALLVLARHHGLAVTAHHVDHGIREGSAAEAAVVESVASRFGAAFRAHRVVVEDGPNLEARARRARYEVLPDGVLTGHTADDQAETVLLFLMRGVGPAGLAGIDPAHRPILGLRREECGRLCRTLGIDAVDDPTNRDPRFRRNRVRRELVPLMSDVAGRDVVPLLARTAALQRDQRSVIDSLTEDIDPRDAASVGGLPTPLAREVLRRWFIEHTGSAYGPDSAALTRMYSVADGTTKATDCGAGWRLERSRGTLRLARTMVGSDGIR